jgi:glutamate 5-kinase
LLAAKVAKLVKADLLIILSSVNGLYDSEEAVKTQKSEALVKEVTKINSKIKKMAGQASNLGKGGMISKIEAAEICFKNKSDMVIASGIRNRPIRSLNGKGKATWFVKK